MKIGGFQKLSLLNYPDKTACTVFASGCNFRCPFCHNSGLVNGEETPVDPEVIFEYLQKRRGMLDGVCVTGGEPLIQSDILPFLLRIKELGYLIKLDTNGSEPERLSEILGRKAVDYVAMDIKNTPEKYAESAGLTELNKGEIQRSVSLIKKSGIPYEFRTTVVRELHTETDIEEIARSIEGASVWFLQPFRDAPEVFRRGLHAPAKEEMEKYRSIGNRYLKTMVRY